MFSVRVTDEAVDRLEKAGETVDSAQKWQYMPRWLDSAVRKNKEYIKVSVAINGDLTTAFHAICGMNGYHPEEILERGMEDCVKGGEPRERMGFRIPKPSFVSPFDILEGVEKPTSEENLGHEYYMFTVALWVNFRQACMSKSDDPTDELEKIMRKELGVSSTGCKSEIKGSRFFENAQLACEMDFNPLSG